MMKSVRNASLNLSALAATGALATLVIRTAAARGRGMAASGSTTTGAPRKDEQGGEAGTGRQSWGWESDGWW